MLTLPDAMVCLDVFLRTLRPMSSLTRHFLAPLLALLVGGLPALSRGGYVLCIGSDGHAHLAVAGHAERGDLTQVSHCHADECCEASLDLAHAETGGNVLTDSHTHPACVDLSVSAAERTASVKTTPAEVLLSPLALPPYTALVPVPSRTEPRFDGGPPRVPSAGAMLRTVILLT